jgi:hypothetical protein
VAIKLTTTADAAKSNGAKILVYSRAGVGKTVLCATAPNPVIISAEAGLLSLSPENIARMVAAGKMRPPPNGKTSFTVIEIQDIKDLTDAFNWCATSKECAGYETICLDSLTEIAEVVLSNAKNQVKDPRAAYGELIEKMTMTIKAFRDLKGKHIYMSAKQELVKDEVIGTTVYMPAMPGSKLGPALPYLFDEVFHLDIGMTPERVEYRYFRTQPDIQFMAKDRSGALDRIEQPDLDVVIRKLLGQA